MQTISITTNYSLKWEVKNYPQYKVTERGVVINCKTGRILKRVVNGGSKGYWIGKDFKTLTELSKLLIKIKHINCPF